MKSWSLTEIIGSLVSKPAHRPSADELDGVDNKGITLRLDPSLRHYLDQRSQQLGGIPVSTLISVILTGVQKTDQRREYSDNGRFFDDIRTIADRIRHLFNHHEYTPLQVSQALAQFDFTPKVFIDDAELVEKISSEVYGAIADGFRVRKKWLVSPRDNRSPCDRDPLRHAAVSILANILDYDEKGILDGIHPICRSSDLKGNAIQHDFDGNGPDVGLLVRLRPGTSGFCHDSFMAWATIPFGYDGARIEYKALIAELYRRYPSGAKFQGLKLDGDVFAAITSGTDLVPHGLNSTAKNVWDVEHYVGSTWAGQDVGLEKSELSAVDEEVERLFSKYR